jgi:hypothetical protein
MDGAAQKRHKSIAMSAIMLYLLADCGITPVSLCLAGAAAVVLVGMIAGHVCNYLRWRANALPCQPWL